MKKRMMIILILGLGWQYLCWSIMSREILHCLQVLVVAIVLIATMAITWVLIAVTIEVMPLIKD